MRFTIKNQQEQEQEKTIEWNLEKDGNDVVLTARLVTNNIDYAIARLEAESGKMLLAGCVSEHLGLALDSHTQIVVE